MNVNEAMGVFGAYVEGFMGQAKKSAGKKMPKDYYALRLKDFEAAKARGDQAAAAHALGRMRALWPKIKPENQKGLQPPDQFAVPGVEIAKQTSAKAAAASKKIDKISKAPASSLPVAPQPIAAAPAPEVEADSDEADAMGLDSYGYSSPAAYNRNVRQFLRRIRKSDSRRAAKDWPVIVKTFQKLKPNERIRVKRPEPILLEAAKINLLATSLATGVSQGTLKKKLEKKRGKGKGGAGAPEVEAVAPEAEADAMGLDFYGYSSPAAYNRNVRQFLRRIRKSDSKRASRDWPVIEKTFSKLKPNERIRVKKPQFVLLEAAKINLLATSLATGVSQERLKKKVKGGKGGKGGASDAEAAEQLGYMGLDLDVAVLDDLDAEDAILEDDADLEDDLDEEDDDLDDEDADLDDEDEGDDEDDDLDDEDEGDDEDADLDDEDEGDDEDSIDEDEGLDEGDEDDLDEDDEDLEGEDDLEEDDDSDLDEVEDEDDDGEEEGEAAMGFDVNARAAQYLSRYSGSAAPFPAGRGAPFPGPRMAGREVF
jgi:hypothetical protein